MNKVTFLVYFMIFSAKKQQLPSLLMQHVELANVKIEFDKLKKHSDQLKLINRLHMRMAGVLNLSEMIEVYSSWLMPLVSHDLVGYNNSNRNKCHLFCFGHGPQRLETIAFAEKMIAEKRPVNGSYSKEKDRHVYRWICEPENCSSIFLILKKRYEACKEIIIQHSLEILAECIRRGLEYGDLFERARTDPLTGLNNRWVFDERIHRMMDGARRYKNPLSMFFMDLDRFKSVNDNFGHQKGDEVLKAVATVLKRMVRSTDLLVRMGGDEFVLVIDNTDLKNGKFLAERLCIAVDEIGIRVDNKNMLGLSIGMSELKAGESLRQWMERTDDLLYQAKAEGRSRVAVESFAKPVITN